MSGKIDEEMFDKNISEVCWQWWQSGQSVVSHLRRQSIYLAFSKYISPSQNIPQLLKSETVTKTYILNRIVILRHNFHPQSWLFKTQNIRGSGCQMNFDCQETLSIMMNVQGRSCDSWNTLTYRLGIMVTMAAEPMVLMTGNDLINIVRTKLSVQLMF